MHCVASSFLLLSVPNFGLSMMKYFSFVHKLHVFVLVEYDFHLSMIVHFIECCMFLSFSDHMY